MWPCAGWLGRWRRNSLMVWPSRLKVMWWTWDQFAGGLGLGAVPPSVRPGAVEVASALGPEPSLAEGRGPDPPVGDGLGEYPTDGRGRPGQPVPGAHRMEPRLAHVGVHGPQLEHGLVVGVRPAPAADASRPGAPGLERPGAAAAPGPAPVVVGASGQGPMALSASRRAPCRPRPSRRRVRGRAGVRQRPRPSRRRSAGACRTGGRRATVSCSWLLVQLVNQACLNRRRASARRRGLELRSLRSLRSRPGATLPRPDRSTAGTQEGSSEMFLNRDSWF